MTWTIDAVYRETVEEALAYREEGVVTVEMEAAALFTIAEVRGVDIAALFVVSDHLLVESEWREAPNKQLLTDGLARILDVSLKVLSPESRFESPPRLDGVTETNSPFI
jgi:purine-nucleoside phosphorylase